MKLKKKFRNICTGIYVIGAYFLVMFAIYDGLGGYSTPHRDLISVVVLIPTLLSFWLSTHF